MPNESTHAGLRHALLAVNLHWLDQAVQLVALLSDEHYASSPAGLYPHRAGSHLRHVLDFYDSFLVGLASGCVDYDARRRDERTASERRFAIDRMRQIACRLKEAVEQTTREALLVSMEDATEELPFPARMPSSVARELQSLSSHTIHHFALIAITLRAHGVALDASFGVAPSTLRYQAQAAA